VNLSKKEREELRMMFGGKCAYCGCELGHGWCADHIEPVYRKTKRVETPDGPFSFKLVPTGEVWHPERNTKENLFPCCRACNIHKGPYALETWRSNLNSLIGVLQRGYPTYRHAVRFGQVMETPSPIVFWFEKYNKVAQ
jgi:hypothetical protein